MGLIPCMGGGAGRCERREQCAHYFSESKAKPVDRLCLPGFTQMFKPVECVPVATLSDSATAAMFADCNYPIPQVI